MTEVLTSHPTQQLSHLMCSQNGNSISDLGGPHSHNAHSHSHSHNHNSPCILSSASEAEPDSSARTDYSTGIPTTLSGQDMGIRYMIPTSDEVRFPPETAPSPPIYNISDPSSLHTNTSPLSYQTFTNIYQPQQTQQSTSYASGGSSYFSPNTLSFSMPDIKPRLGSYASPPLNPLTTRSPLPHPTNLSQTTSINPLSTLDTRSLYTGATPHLRRASDILRSPGSYTRLSSSTPLSPSPSAFSPSLSLSHPGSTHGGIMDHSLHTAGASPPLEATQILYTLATSTSQTEYRPEIHARIDKGFFLADNDWTCYRRNYFSVSCSYTITPSIPTGTMYLVSPHGGMGSQVQGFSMSIAAVVDGREGKAIELVQHTPKRDKGPQEKPARISLSPKPANSLPSSSYSLSGSHHNAHMFDTPYGGSPAHPATEASFERIQFKNATANNGKRRAAQQYYHLLVELFADIGLAPASSGPMSPKDREAERAAAEEARWVKIASKISAPMVVRGRSPGHYEPARRGSASAGGGSGGNLSGGAGYASSSGGGRGGGMSNSGMGGGYSGGYGGYDGGRHYSSRSSVSGSVSASLVGQLPLEPTLAPEEGKSIEESSGYLYYPSPIWEGAGSGGEYTVSSGSSRVKNEYSSPSTASTGSTFGSGSSGNQYVLPSLTSDWLGLGGRCGRFEGVGESKGYFPTAMMQHELNIT